MTFIYMQVLIICIYGYFKSANLNFNLIKLYFCDFEINLHSYAILSAFW